ncbi:uncharacterized protein DS421_2g37580 [Arachis hypogaea]|nr:uncharacterized protein DS421_2g37580 [Arachis hypogaea]
MAQSHYHHHHRQAPPPNPSVLHRYFPHFSPSLPPLSLSRSQVTRHRHAHRNNQQGVCHLRRRRIFPLSQVCRSSRLHSSSPLHRSSCLRQSSPLHWSLPLLLGNSCSFNTTPEHRCSSSCSFDTVREPYSTLLPSNDLVLAQ